MSGSSQGTSTNTNNDNLGISWEIGVIIGIIVIVLSVIAAAIFQRRRRRLALNLAQDLEKTQRRRSPTNISSTRPYSSSSTTLKETKESTNMAVEVPDFKSTTIPKPLPSASSAILNSKRSSRAEYFLEHPSQKPPNYYWDHRS
ncbi:hypothetical protein C8J55DRAFT_605323 [Lentinula edodes]|uniref:Uncharacterized protein n=1 Tax=Lentinula lateritia TaxID=40482 RepID=A0A9W9AJ12_9AGAR|nr:hypothetical protein C8J55DRAFT_605323 [Lentinula edodes]